MFSPPLLCHTTVRILRRRMTDRFKCQAFLQGLTVVGGIDDS